VQRGKRVGAADPAEPAEREHARMSIAAACKRGEFDDAAGSLDLGARDLYAKRAVVAARRMRGLGPMTWTTERAESCSDRDDAQHARIVHDVRDDS